MGRPPLCQCDKVVIKKGPWTPEEDIILVSYIHEHGPGKWRLVAINTGLMRCGKSCRLRWTNYLRPGIRRGNFTPHEEGVIVHLQSLLGNRWAAIASHLSQRTDNDIKNYWNTHLKKKLGKEKLQQAIGGATVSVPHPAAGRVDRHHAATTSSSVSVDSKRPTPSAAIDIHPFFLSFDQMSSSTLPPISSVPPTTLLLPHQVLMGQGQGHGGFFHEPRPQQLSSTQNWLDESNQQLVIMESSDGFCSVPSMLF